jgi:hypothetical protein
VFLQWGKANVGIVSKVSETNKFESFSQWTKAIVGIVSEVLETNEFELLS